MNTLSKYRLIILVFAAVIQYVGASAKRQFLFLIKVLVFLVPGVKDALDRNLAPPSNSGSNAYDRMMDIGDAIANNIIDEEGDIPKGLDKSLRTPSSFENITDFLIDLFFWLFTLIASLIAYLGSILEAATALVADLLRSSCSSEGFSLRTSFRNLMLNFDETSDYVENLVEANRRVSIDNTVSNHSYSCTCTPSQNKSISSFSFAAQDSDYSDSGVRYDFLLLDNKIRFGKRPSGLEGLSLSKAPNLVKYPFEMENSGMSYHTKRKGEIMKLEFDMISASNDRVFAKVKGKSDFYFASMDELFGHNGGGSSPNVPGIYFKLDPQFGHTNASGQPIDTVGENSPVMSISDANNNLLNYPNHPQAERLHLFHALIGKGLLDAMIVSVNPRVWYRLDTRPPLNGVEIDGSLSNKYEIREASEYRKTWFTEKMPPEEKVPKYEFSFSHVLSLGVGNFHFYESWIDDYGGEIQPMHQQWFSNLPLIRYTYTLFNGPVRDGDGACDGTCNFYVLVKLVSKKTSEDCYGILWCDEQTYFTKRWRLVDPRDNAPWRIDIPKDINLSLVAELERDQNGASLLNNQFNFDKDAYLASDPFEQKWINSNSRMAVARQVILVTGVKKAKRKIFSVNFSYGSIDRVWRSRDLPCKNIIKPLVPKPNNSKPPAAPKTAVKPETIFLREDMTITLEGSHEDYGNGFWCQRYLPCSRQYPQITSDYEFTHPWRFYPEKAFHRADAFSHFGVYDQVDSRNQYYVVEHIESSLSIHCPMKLRDRFKKLYIRAIKFNWGIWRDQEGLVNFLEDNGSENCLPKGIRQGTELESLAEKLLFRWDQTVDVNNQSRKSKTSAHNDLGKFVLLERGPLGYILVWDDKRDDDLFSLTDLPLDVPLLGHGVHKFRILKNVVVTSSPNVFKVELSLITKHKLKVRIITYQRETSAIENIWAIHIACLPASQSLDRVIIYETKNLLKHKIFLSTYNAVQNEAIIEGTVDIEPGMSDYLTGQGPHIHATSVWFEDVVGHVSTPDIIEFK